MTELAQQQPVVGTFGDRRTHMRNDPVRRAHQDVIFNIARASERHDQDTASHLHRIRLIVQRIALTLGFNEEDAEELAYDAMLHDVGKLVIPVEILRKPEQLSEPERAIMQSHTVRGEQLLIGRPSLRRAARIARSHHEAWDGSGYPDRLAGCDIPQEARITSAADVLDALIAQRAYKQAWSYEQAMQEVLTLAGTRLDPTVVEAIDRCNAEGSLCEIFGVSTRCVDPLA